MKTRSHRMTTRSMRTNETPRAENEELESDQAMASPVAKLPESIMMTICQKVRELAVRQLEEKCRPYMACPIRISKSLFHLEAQRRADPSAQFGFIMSLKKGVTPPSYLDDVIIHAPVYASRTFIAYEFEDEHHFVHQMRTKMPVVKHVRFFGLPPVMENANFTYPQSCYQENRDLSGPYTRVNYGRSLKQLRTCINQFKKFSLKLMRNTDL